MPASIEKTDIMNGHIERVLNVLENTQGKAREPFFFDNLKNHASASLLKNVVAHAANDPNITIDEWESFSDDIVDENVRCAVAKIITHKRLNRTHEAPFKWEVY